MRSAMFLFVASLFLSLTIPQTASAACPTNNQKAFMVCMNRQMDVMQNRIANLEAENETLRQTVGEQVEFISSLQDVMDVDSDTVIFSGVNVYIQNGEGTTNTINGLGNLIVGYDEEYCVDYGGGNVECYSDKSGSHNIVVGEQNSYESYGAAIIGYLNASWEPYASTFGGTHNTAGDRYASVFGGSYNYAAENTATVVGGEYNVSAATGSAVCGGYHNYAEGTLSTIVGGEQLHTTEWTETVVGE